MFASLTLLHKNTNFPQAIADLFAQHGVQTELQQKKKVKIKRKYTTTKGHVQNVTGGCVKRHRRALSSSRKARRQKETR